MDGPKHFIIYLSAGRQHVLGYASFDAQTNWYTVAELALAKISRNLVLICVIIGMLHRRYIL